VTATRYNGTIHDFVLLNALRELPETKAALQQVSDGVRDALEASDGVRAALKQKEMTAAQGKTQRLTVTSEKPFETVVAVGHPDMRRFASDIDAAKNGFDMEGVVQRAVGKTGFIEFARFDLGAVLRKETPNAPKSLRLLVGSPLVMKEMVKHLADAGSYAPVTVLIDERADGVHLSYDRVAAFLAPYGNTDAVRVARDLDAKVEKLLTDAAL
jgi:uncharacterized protein (DUF302 family)